MGYRKIKHMLSITPTLIYNINWLFFWV